MDPSQFDETHDTDLPFPVRYECMGFSVSVEALESLADNSLRPGSKEFIERAQKLGPPFKRLSQIRSRSQLGFVDLAEVSGAPYIAVAKRESIMFKNLNTGASSSFTTRRRQAHQNTVSCSLFVLLIAKGSCRYRNTKYIGSASCHITKMFLSSNRYQPQGQCTTLRGI